MNITTVHSFDVAFLWDESLGLGWAHAGSRMPIALNPPPEFGGKDANWSPEHLLIAALSSCYTNTFLHFAKLLKVRVASFRIDASADFEKGKTGFEATHYILKPVVKFAENPDAAIQENLFSKAKKYCLISNSVKGKISVEPKVLSA